MGRVTLANVAAEVGVSAKTVSNVVNGTGWVSDPVREKVRKAVRELGYRPNTAARQLRNGRSGMLAFGIPNLREPYFAEFAATFVDRAHERGINVLITQTGGDRAAERAFIEGDGLPSVDGIVVSPLTLERQDIVERTSPTPLVLLGEHGSAVSTPDVLHVGIDNVAAARAATQYLLARGRRRIAVVGVQHEGSTDTSHLRTAGYREALAVAGIPVEEELLGVVEDFNRAEGSRVIDDFVNRGIAFDALFCFNDTMAYGALYSLAAHGLSTNDIDVIGFDDIEEGRYVVPAFSTVNARIDLQSDRALDALGDGKTSGRLEVPFLLVER
jgi:DNA-binding LacI/PurR family transcriptional regulator